MLLGFLSCKEAIARLDDYIDRELSPREMILVARHLKICAHCAREFAFEAELVAGLRAKIQRIEAPPELLQKIRASLPDSPEN
ncbi:anti-sigma factor, TIGR02949 family [Abditibacterium utsteinense]|uniref:Anti-sigma factor, TIGR02949 family n=1 Tax=Abditibacterium utsteinense TaxID=1960156 RepID=A0A2S8SQF5_9BACT|nr:zf-HC2 domain-containing protein [Abditibacterium utsteinense]PQV63032.1 anti-sigma factor, TIGR02949 family [Abditibacterium utsteinense]